jgi:potassium-dependent mechanosensitive channel
MALSEAIRHTGGLPRMLHAGLFLFAALLPSLLAQTPAQGTAPGQTSAQAPASSAAPEPIPLTQIASRGEELSRTLRDISRSIPADSDLAEFEEQLVEQEQLVRERLQESERILASGATIMEIREQVREWAIYSAAETRQRKTLSEWGASCEDSIALLNKQQAVWQATLNSTRNIPDIESVQARVRHSLHDIQTLKDAAGERLRTIVGLQGRVSKQSVAVADVLEKLNHAARRFQDHLFYPDSPPIWRASEGAQGSESLDLMLSRSVARSYSGAAAFARARPGLIITVILLLALAFAGARRVDYDALNARIPDPSTSLASRILRRPVALAVLVAAPLILTSLPLAQISVVLWLILLFLFPVVRLLPLFLKSGRLIYFLSTFYALSTLAVFIEADPYRARKLSVWLLVAAMLILVWWGWPVRLRGAFESTTSWWRVGRLDIERTPTSGPRLEVRMIRATAVALAVILVSNVLGFVMLSNLLRTTAVLWSYVGLVMYTLVRVVSTLFTAFLRSPRLRSLATVRLHEAKVVKWMNFAVRVGALFCWLYVTLDLLGLRRAVYRTMAAVFNARITINAFSISLGDILGFVSILAFGYLIAAAIRFILREEVLSHLRLSRGVPEMISTSLFYVLLLLVFFMSLSAAGVQLDKLTVLTGAFGVGVGFGMQNVVNNFVSGLILQYERPIRVGDILEVSGVSGAVSRIGIRASTITTFQGAEVIIPNSAFISNQVTNWTLSKSRRRVEINVGVAYGTDPQRVIAILTKVAGDHPEVLKQPEPGAFFQDFGPSSLLFILMFWADQSTFFRLRSEISIMLNAALREAGIEIPLPQQDIHVRHVDSSAFPPKERPEANTPSTPSEGSPPAAVSRSART